MRQHDSESEIRALIQAWSKALERKDAGGLVASYAQDALLFDAIPPFRSEGPEAIRKVWESCLPYFPKEFKSEHRDFDVTASDDLAFARGLHRIVPIGETHPAGDMWLRVTTCYQRIAGEWRVVHEHVSLPFDPATGKAVSIKSPEDEAELVPVGGAAEGGES